MKHEAFHELLCLRVYGELSADEERLLAQHLTGCADCRAFGDELAGSLGALASEQAARAAELPGDWHERLAERVRVARARRWGRPLATFAAGLAAGLLLMAALRSPHSPASTDLGPSLDGAPPFVLRTAPPPPASGRGPLARLSGLLRR